MTFAALVEQLAADARLTKHEVRAVLVAFEALLSKDVLLDGGTVRVPGLGTFRRQRRMARPIRCPVTGSRLDLPADERVAFRPASALRRKAVRQ